MSTIAELTRRRPTRADARRNYDAIIAAARDAFAELGTGVALEEIARRAGVGIATLYRNFATREELIESVYLGEVVLLAEAAAEYESLPPWEALRAWLDSFVRYTVTKRALIVGLNRDSEAFKASRAVLYGSGEPLLKRAQEAGAVRKDTSIDDVMRLVAGITATGFVDDAQRERVLSLALDGLRLG